jgi:hypothetical protein
MTRIAAAVLVTLSSTTAALAQARPSTTSMTCAQSARTVAAQGAVVLGTGGLTYDRFVRDRRFCEATEITEDALVPALDNPSCFIGYRCKEPSRDNFGNF